MPDGTPVMYGGNSPHFLWVAQNEYNDEETNRWIASQQVSFTILPGLRLQNSAGLETERSWDPEKHKDEPIFRLYPRGSTK